jgi:replication factor C subunit 1
MSLTNINNNISNTINVQPKKRGRKQKIFSNIKQVNNIIDDKETSGDNLEKDNLETPGDNLETNNSLKPTLKKRGRKPKNYLNQDYNKKEQNTDVDIKLSKVIDFSDIIQTNNSDLEPEKTDILSNIWLNKYQPKNLNEIVGNKNQIIKIKKWLLNYDNQDKHATVISGGHGIGKNLTIKLALEETNYQIKNIYSTSLKNKFIISELIQSCTKTKNVYNSLSKNNNIKYAIVIDDTESITLSSERDNLTELCKLNSLHKYFPIIFICNLQHSKLINNLKKSCLEITLLNPEIEHIKNYIVDICKKEKMNITDDKIYYQIIRFCQFDFRRLMFILQDLHYTYNKNPITIDMFKEYQFLSQKKNIDIGLYVAAKNLLDNYININECLQLYETEKVLLPLTIYENYHRKIFKQKLSPDNILHVMNNITNSISIGDVIETNIYSDQNWFLQNIHGFYTCADSSYTINSVIPSEQKKVKLDYELVFSADLNKTSSKNINKKKNILCVQSKFKNKNIDDILYINKIFYELDKNKSTTIIKSIKDCYDIDNKNIQIALKIDKTNDKINEKLNSKKYKNTNNDADETDIIDENENENVNVY